MKKTPKQQGWKPSEQKRLIQANKENDDMIIIRTQDRRITLLEEILIKVIPDFLAKFTVDGQTYKDTLNAALDTNFNLTGVVTINEYNIEAVK